MPTKTDLITRALRRLNITRAGQAVPGNLFTEAKDVLDDYLLAFHEEHGLDFDPTGDEIPSERMGPLTLILANRIGPNYGRPFDLNVERVLEAQLRNGMAESDHIEPSVEDF